MVKAVFLDRDGTINVEKHYLYKIEDFEFLPGVIDGLRLLQDNSYVLVIVTNQSGLARGYYTEEDYNVIDSWLLEELKKNGITISLSLYCPHHPEAKVLKYRENCNCRKPKTGLYDKAVEILDIDLASSFVIGDKIRDCALCGVSDCRGFLIAENEDQDIINQVKCGNYKNVEYAVDLEDAARRIVSYGPVSRFSTK